MQLEMHLQNQFAIQKIQCIYHCLSSSFCKNCFTPNVQTQCRNEFNCVVEVIDPGIKCDYCMQMLFWIDLNNLDHKLALLLKKRLLKFHKKKENTSKLALLAPKSYHWAIFKQVTTILIAHCIDQNLVFLKNEK